MNNKINYLSPPGVELVNIPRVMGVELSLLPGK